MANFGRAFTQANDGGHMNFKKGGAFSKIFKGTHDLKLKYSDTGVFVRGKCWYNFELKDESRLLKDIDDHNCKDGDQSSGAEILDALSVDGGAVSDVRPTCKYAMLVASVCYWPRPACYNSRLPANCGHQH